MRWVFYHVHVIGPEQIISDGWVSVQNGRIEAVGTGAFPDPEVLIDGRGTYLSPGFIDLHIHGGGGADFSDADTDAYLTVLRTHLRGGTTTIVPTLMSGSLSNILDNLSVYEALHQHRAQHPDIPHLGGLHLEGPYFSKSQLGAQDANFVREPIPEEYERILAKGQHIKRWAAACEVPGAMSFGDRLSDLGITPCIGHSNATLSEVRTALKHGYRCVTHLYSSCSMVHRNGPFRECGIVEAAFLFDSLDVEIIGDGIHLPPDLMRLIYKLKGADRTALITDCIRPGGSNPPEHSQHYSDREKLRPVIVESGVAIMPDKKSFAGSIVTMGQVVQTAALNAAIPLCDVIRMAALTPARMLGIEKETGSIEPGKRADLVLMDQTLKVCSVFLPDKAMGLRSIDAGCNL